MHLFLTGILYLKSNYRKLLLRIITYYKPSTYYINILYKITTDIVMMFFWPDPMHFFS